MNIKIAEAAKLMGKSQQFVRIQMQRGLLPIGTVKENPNGRKDYYISPELFEKFTGIKYETTKKENS